MYSKQCEEIKELSQKNQELTKQLVDRIEEFGGNHRYHYYQ